MNRMKKTAKGKKGATAKPKFDRKALNPSFFNVAKQNKDEVKGWAFDFDND